MSRWLVMLFAMLLPLQFAWSAAAAYCQHETASQASSAHVGHHFHAHDGEPAKSAANPLAADADCATCHAAGAPLIAARPLPPGPVAVTTPAAARAPLPFTSALARAPDRPQWPRLV